MKLNLDWVEKLDISVNVEEIEESPDVNVKDPDSKAEHDFKREMSL